MTTDTDTTVGAAVRELRKRFGWGQKDLADRSSLKHASDGFRSRKRQKKPQGVRGRSTRRTVSRPGRGFAHGSRLQRSRTSSCGEIRTTRLPGARLRRGSSKGATDSRFLRRSRGDQPDRNFRRTPGFRERPIRRRRRDRGGNSQHPSTRRRRRQEPARDIESRWGVMVFQELMDNGSGATTRGEFGTAILENAAEPPKRRAFSLAHELFHLLTWGDEPRPTGGETEDSSKREEQMANAFAAALLMPADVVKRKLGWHRDSPAL